MKLNAKHFSDQLDKILDEDGLSPEKLALQCNISHPTLYRILNNKTKGVQRNIARKIAEGTGRKFKIEGDKIYYYKPPKSEKDLESWRDIELYQPITPLSEFDQYIKDLGLPPHLAQPLMYIPLFKYPPKSLDNWDATVQSLQIGVITTVFQEGKDRLFALRVKDNTMADLIKKDAIVTADPHSPIEDNKFAVVSFPDNSYIIRKYYKQNNQILLISQTNPPECFFKNQFETIYRLIQVIQLL